uniref:Uncharacterized protein n=1 Tax=Meleagris gallopavo TaxID=9103 RepID=A0A803XUK2_MELGA
MRHIKSLLADQLTSAEEVLQRVKQIMEEAVTRKFVHEDSSHIIALCEQCLRMTGE